MQASRASALAKMDVVHLPWKVDWDGVSCEEWADIWVQPGRGDWGSMVHLAAAETCLTRLAEG